MGAIRIILVNSWWQNPYLIELFSAILTGVIFAIVIVFFNRHMGKRDILTSLTSELTNDYKSIVDIDNISNASGFDVGAIAAIRKGMPWNEELSDNEIILDFLKNQPLDQELSIDCWNKVQSEVAKYSNDFVKFEEIYRILKRIIRFSKQKREINQTSLAERAALGPCGAIRRNSEDFINRYEEYFKT